MKLASKALETVRKALKDPHALILSLAAAAAMTRQTLQVCKGGGANSHELQPWVIPNALGLEGTYTRFAETPQLVRERMAAAATATSPALLSVPLLADGRVNASLGLKKEAISQLDDLIVKAATSALTKSHHITEMADCLRRRNMYDWRVDHDDDVKTDDPAHPERRTKEWFGVLDHDWDDYGDGIVGQYKQWCAHLKTLDPETRAELNSSKEWAKSANKYPLLYNAARWHCAISTSSVAVERVFAIMRKMEASDRLTMKEEAFQYELFFRCNPWLVERVWEKYYSAMPRST